MQTTLQLFSRLAAWRFVRTFHDVTNEPCGDGVNWWGGNFTGVDDVSLPCYGLYGSTQEDVAQRMKAKFLLLLKNGKWGCHYNLRYKIYPAMLERKAVCVR